MSENQFKKRQKKIAAVVEEAKANSEELAVPVKAAEISGYTHVGTDIYSLDGGRTFGVAEIEYNPVTMLARVKETFNISRLVALSYQPQKTALNTLKKSKK